MFLPQSERPSFAQIQHNWQNYSFVCTYIYIYLFLGLFIWDGKTKYFVLNNSKHPRIYSAFDVSWMSFWFVSVVPKYLNFATFSNDSLAILIFWFCPEFRVRHGPNNILIYNFWGYILQKTTQQTT
jgi:hypothetical protein